MIRVALDTNVVISGQLWSGAPRQVIRAAQQGLAQTLISEAMMDELRDVLNRPKFVQRLEAIGKTAGQVISEYLQFTQIVEAATIQPTVLDDPDDDIVLACALGGKADYIVTGDEHLLTLGTYKSIHIWGVHQFLQRIQIT